jgi:hypothetical protein
MGISELNITKFPKTLVMDQSKWPITKKGKKNLNFGMHHN